MDGCGDELDGAHLEAASGSRSRQPSHAAARSCPSSTASASSLAIASSTAVNSLPKTCPLRCFAKRLGEAICPKLFACNAHQSTPPFVVSPEQWRRLVFQPEATYHSACIITLFPADHSSLLSTEVKRRLTLTHFPVGFL